LVPDDAGKLLEFKEESPSKMPEECGADIEIDLHEKGPESPGAEGLHP